MVECHGYFAKEKKIVNKIRKRYTFLILIDLVYKKSDRMSATEKFKSPLWFTVLSNIFNSS